MSKLQNELSLREIAFRLYRMESTECSTDKRASNMMLHLIDSIYRDYGKPITLRAFYCDKEVDPLRRGREEFLTLKEAKDIYVIRTDFMVFLAYNDFVFQEYKKSKFWGKPPNPEYREKLKAIVKSYNEVRGLPCGTEKDKKIEELRKKRNIIWEYIAREKEEFHGFQKAFDVSSEEAKYREVLPQVAKFIEHYPEALYHYEFVEVRVEGRKGEYFSYREIETGELSYNDFLSKMLKYVSFDENGWIENVDWEKITRLRESNDIINAIAYFVGYPENTFKKVYAYAHKERKKTPSTW